MQVTTRLRGALACAVLVATLAPPATSPGYASAISRMFGKPTYESFKGKFIDSDVVHEATAAALPAAASRKPGDAGHFVGSAMWDGIPQPELHAYAESILAKLLAGWGGEHPKMRLWITSDPGLEAESNSAGDLFLARGWFDNVESEDEIAAVMAHEVSHVLLGHFSRDDEHERGRMAVTGAASAASMAFTVGSLRPQGTGMGTTLAVGDQGKLNHKIRDAAMIRFAVDEIADVAVNAPWAREQEDQADLLGIDLLYRAKYNVLAMRDVLQRLADYEKTLDQKIDVLSGNYDDMLKDSLTSSTDVTTLTASLEDKAKSWMWSVAGKLNERYVRAHPDTQARLDDVAKYIAREYEDDPGPKPNTASFKKIVSGKGIHAVLSEHTDAVQASALTDDKDRTKRASLAAKAARQGVSDAPFPLRVMAQTVSDGGGGAKALVLYRRAADSPEASFTTMTMLAAAYADTRDFSRARGVLDEAARRFESAEAIYPMQIMIDLKQGDQKDADATLKLCVALKNEGLSKQCKVAHGENCDGLECLFNGGTKDLKENSPSLLP